MPTVDNAVILPSTGGIYTAPVGTTVPTDLANIASPWDQVGYTSRDDLPEFDSDGGDTDVLGVWENAVFRQVQKSASIDNVNFNIQQLSSLALAMYYGATGAGSAKDRFDVQNVGTAPLSRALLITIVDGSNRVGFYAYKASFTRKDSIKLDTDKFADWPIQATFLKVAGQPLFSWIYPGLGAVS